MQIARNPARINRVSRENVGPIECETGELIMGIRKMTAIPNKYFGSIFRQEGI